MATQSTRRINFLDDEYQEYAETSLLAPAPAPLSPEEQKAQDAKAAADFADYWASKANEEYND